MDRVGPYLVVGEIGRGGFGVVLRGRAPDGRDVAIKLSLEPGKNGQLERFERERRLLTELADDGGFVPINDAGQTPRGPYVVMPYVGGGTLRRRLARGGPLPLGEAVEVVRVVAEAVGRAHARGIVHRDLKPENILFTDEGEPLVADLGLAKHFAPALSGKSRTAELSRTGELRGTLGYMAPEHMRSAKEVGPTADVFALGAILYECLTGHRAFDGPTTTDVIARVLDGKYERVRRAAPDVPTWLAAIVERCLSADPDARYLDATDVALALERGPTGAGRWRARLAGALVAAGVAAVGFHFTQRGTTSAPPPPPAPRPAAPPSAHKPVPPPPNVARAVVPETAQATSLVVVGRLGSHAFRHGGVPTSISVSGPPGDEYAVVGTADGFVHWWRVPDGEELHVFRVFHDETIQAVHAIPGNERGAFVVGERRARYVVPARAHRSDMDQHRAKIVSSACAWKKPLAATLDASGRLYVWDLSTKLGVLDLDASVATPRGVAFTPDDQRVVVGGSNGNVIPVQISPKEVQPGLVTTKVPIRALAFSPDGDLVAASVNSGEGRLFNLKEGRRGFALEALSTASVLAFGPDHVFFGALSSGTVFSCNADTNQAKVVPDGSRVTPGVAVAPFARKAYYLSHPVGQPRVIGILDRDEGHEGQVTALVALPDGRLASGGADGSVRLWDATGRQLAVAREHEQAIVALASTADGVVSAARNGAVVTLDGTTARVRSRRSARGVVTSVCVTPDGAAWAATSTGLVAVERATSVKGPTESVLALEVVGDRLLAWDRAGTLALLHPRTMESAWRRTIVAKAAEPVVAAVSPERAAVAHGDQLLLIDLATGADVWTTTIENRGGRIAASADGRLVAVPASNLVLLLSAKTGEVLSRAAVTGNVDAATIAAFGGDQLFVGTARGPIVRLALAP